MQAYSTDNLSGVKVTYLVRSRPDSQGNTQPAEVDGDIQYELLQGDCQIVVEEGTGGKVVTFLSGSANTVNRIRQYADKIVGEGVENIEDEIVYTVTSAEAASFAGNAEIVQK